MDITGDQTTPPYRVGYPIADTIGGLTAALAVSAALHQKTSQHIDVSMLESILTTMGWAVSNLLMQRTEPSRVGNENLTSAPSGAFHTQDGLINIAANQDQQWVQLTDVLAAQNLKTDSRYLTRELRKLNRYELKSDIEKILCTKKTSDWLSLLNAANVPAGPILSVQEALQLGQIKDREFTHTLKQNVPATEIDVVTNGFLLDGQRLTPQSLVESLGESTDRILSELGYDHNHIRKLKKRGAIK